MIDPYFTSVFDSRKNYIGKQTAPSCKFHLENEMQFIKKVFVIAKRHFANYYFGEDPSIYWNYDSTLHDYGLGFEYGFV